jgi:hypothetical protein
VAYRQRDGERGSEAGLARHQKGAAEQLREPARQRKSQPGAAHPALQTVLELAELLEDPLLILRGDADSRVGHDERDRPGRIVHPDRDAHFPALGELQRVGDQVAQDLRHLGFIGVQRGQVRRVFEDEGHGLVEQQRPQHAAERAEQLLHLEVRSPDDGLPGFHLGEIQQIVYQSRQLIGRADDVAELRLRLTTLLTAILEHELAQPDDGVHRRPELVRHVREKARFQIVGAPQVIRPFVELRVERHDAAVGVFELAVEMGQLLLLPLELVQRRQQFVILLLHFLDQAFRAPLQYGLRDLMYRLTCDEAAARGQGLLEDHIGTVGGGLDREAVHQPPRAHDPAPRTGPRLILSPEHFVQALDTGPVVVHADDQALRTCVERDHEFDPAPACVPQGIARNFRHRRRDSRLVGEIELEQSGDLGGAPARRDHILIVMQVE